MVKIIRMIVKISSEAAVMAIAVINAGVVRLVNSKKFLKNGIKRPPRNIPIIRAINPVLRRLSGREIQ